MSRHKTSLVLFSYDERNVNIVLEFLLLSVLYKECKMLVRIGLSETEPAEMLPPLVACRSEDTVHASLTASD